MNSYKVFLTETVEHFLMLTVEAVDEDMAKEVAEQCAEMQPWCEIYGDNGLAEHWTDSDGVEIYAVDKIQTDPPATQAPTVQ